MFVEKTPKDKKDITAMIEGKHDLEVEQYATISGIRGKQFGREIFSSLLKFKDLMKFLTVFPEVQRQASRQKIGQIKTYISSGIENPELMRFFSAITVTCSSHVFYDENNHRIAIDIQNSKLSVNDGQHRIFSINEVIEELERRSSNARDKETRSKAHRQAEELKEMIIPVVIFNQITKKEQKQLFHDLNNLASRPSRSANIRLNQVDLVAIMSRELATENHFLSRYGVEMDKLSIHGSNSNLVLLTTVYAMIKELFWNDFLKNSQYFNDYNYQDCKELVDDTLTRIFRSLPHDVHDREKYIIGKNYTLKGIAKFIHTCRNELKMDDEQLIFDTIKNVDWSPNITKWSLYGGSRSKHGNLVFAGGSGGIYAVHEVLLDTMKFTDHKQALEELQNDSKAI